MLRTPTPATDGLRGCACEPRAALLRREVLRGVSSNGPAGEPPSLSSFNGPQLRLKKRAGDKRPPHPLPSKPPPSKPPPPPHPLQARRVARTTPS
eukprot:361026-Chlamydomonas_euryale.AAC.8